MAAARTGSTALLPAAKPTLGSRRTSMSGNAASTASAVPSVEPLSTTSHSALIGAEPLARRAQGQDGEVAPRCG